MSRILEEQKEYREKLRVNMSKLTVKQLKEICRVSKHTIKAAKVGAVSKLRKNDTIEVLLIVRGRVGLLVPDSLSSIVFDE